jgi:hypothetical protein
MGPGIIKSNRLPLCGGDAVTENLKAKVMEIVKRNQERFSSLQTTSRNNNASDGYLSA